MARIEILAPKLFRLINPIAVQVLKKCKIKTEDLMNLHDDWNIDLWDVYLTLTLWEQDHVRKIYVGSATKKSDGTTKPYGLASRINSYRLFRFGMNGAQKLLQGDRRKLTAHLKAIGTKNSVLSSSLGPFQFRYAEAPCSAARECADMVPGLCGEAFQDIRYLLLDLSNKIHRSADHRCRRTEPDVICGPEFWVKTTQR